MTMKELAEIAGVSPSAVSRYLNGGSLSQDKRERIQQAMEETGYQPDAIAQMLRTKATDHVGLIVPKLDSDAVTRVTRGASQTLAEEGFLGLLADTNNNPEKELAYLKLFQNRPVAGIIMMATVMTPQHEEIIKNSPIPIVIVGQQFRHVPCVYHDDFGAAYDLTKLILEKGRRKLGFIGVTERDVAVGINRRRGVEAAMKEFDLDPTSLAFSLCDFTTEGGQHSMQLLLDQTEELDGLICATDRIAFGAMETLKQRGIRIPEDISVVGLDDNWAGKYILPHLTTAHFYYKTSGETAAQLLIDMIRNKKSSGPIMQTMLGYTIETRCSV